MESLDFEESINREELPAPKSIRVVLDNLSPLVFQIVTGLYKYEALPFL